VYIWHDANGVHIWVTTPQNVFGNYFIRVTPQPWVNPNSHAPEALEDNGEVVNVSQNAYIFLATKTKGDFDGMVLGFPATVLLIEIKDTTTSYASTDIIWVGSGGAHPSSNPFKVYYPGD